MKDDSKVATTQALSFEKGGTWRSKLVAGLLFLAIVLWMLSGIILPAPEEAVVARSTGPVVVSVAVRASTAKSVIQEFVAEGQALPDRDTKVRAETSGQVAEVLVEKGSEVTSGQIIARIKATDRDAQLNRAKEGLIQAKRDFENAETLLASGTATKDRVVQARTALAAAEAQLVSAEQALIDTIIRAPFAGRLDDLTINEGEFVSEGAEIGRVIDSTPLTIVVQVPQQALRSLKKDAAASVSFITGEMRDGRISFLATSADPETRTFRAEITVENQNGDIPAGVSAEVRIKTGSAMGHFVSPAMFSLDADGTLGVKSVNQQNVVMFHEISVIRAETEGVWVAGIPEQADIIVVGQGFVNDGETVAPSSEIVGDVK